MKAVAFRIKGFQGEAKPNSAQTLAAVQSGREVSGFQFMKEFMQRG